MAQSAGELPRYSDGDVEIVLSAVCRYQLHAQTLRRASRVFAALLDGDGAALSARARARGVVVRHRLSLVEAGGVYSFQREAVDSEGRSRGVGGVGGLGANGADVDAVVAGMTLVLRAIYNLELAFDFTDVRALAEDVMGVLGCAELLGAAPSVTKSLESALLTQEQQLFVAISQQPTEWIKVAKRLSSRTIFKEAMIHIVGRYNELAVAPYTSPANSRINGLSKLSSLPRDILTLVNQHRDELTKTIKAIHNRLSSWYPEQIKRNNNTGSAKGDGFNLRDYEKDIKDWMALTMFHQYCMLQLTDKMAIGSSDTGFQSIQKLFEGGQSYLSLQACAQWHRRFPMSKRGQGIIQNSLDEIKKQISTIVAPLIITKCQLNTTLHPVAWFTCIEVDVSKFEFVQNDSGTTVRSCSPTDPAVPDWLAGAHSGSELEENEVEDQEDEASISAQNKAPPLNPRQPTSGRRTQNDTSTLRKSRRGTRTEEEQQDDHSTSALFQAPSLNPRQPTSRTRKSGSIATKRKRGRQEEGEEDFHDDDEAPVYRVRKRRQIRHIKGATKILNDANSNGPGEYEDGGGNPDARPQDQEQPNGHPVAPVAEEDEDEDDSLFVPPYAHKIQEAEEAQHAPADEVDSLFDPEEDAIQEPGATEHATREAEAEIEEWINEIQEEPNEVEAGDNVSPVGTITHDTNSSVAVNASNITIGELNLDNLEISPVNMDEIDTADPNNWYEIPEDELENIDWKSPTPLPWTPEPEYSSPESHAEQDPDRAFWYTDRSDVDRMEQQYQDRLDAAEGLLAFGAEVVVNAPEDNAIESIERDP